MTIVLLRGCRCGMMIVWRSIRSPCSCQCDDDILWIIASILTIWGCGLWDGFEILEKGSGGRRSQWQWVKANINRAVDDNGNIKDDSGNNAVNNNVNNNNDNDDGKDVDDKASSNSRMAIGLRYLDDDYVMMMGGHWHAQCSHALRCPSKAAIN